MTPILVVVLLLSLVRLFESFETELLLGTPWGFFVYSTMIVDLARQDPPLTNQAAALGSIILVFLAVFIPLQRKLIGARQFTTVTSHFKAKLIDIGSLEVRGGRGHGRHLLPGSGRAHPEHPGRQPDGALRVLRPAPDLDPGVLARRPERPAAHAGAPEHAHHRRGLGGSGADPVFPHRLHHRAHPASRAGACWTPSAGCPSAVPGVLAGLGLLWMFLGTPFFRPLYGTLFLLIIASMMGGITLATQVLKANFIQLGKELEEASLTSGAGFWSTYFRIVLPLMGQTMALIAVLKFLFAARTASSVILLATSETRTLALLALDQIAGGYREPASITVLFIVLLTTGVALVARSFRASRWGFRAA